MHIMRRLRGRKIRNFISDNYNFYSNNWTSDKIQIWQLEQFNNQWQLICQNVPYFQKMHQRKKVPYRFSSWREFKDTMPVMNRKTVQNNGEELIDRTRSPDSWRSTGGSTAEPIQFPIWKSEIEHATKDMWYARSWFGIDPSDRLFLIWGHSHLLGHGFGGWINKMKCLIRDRMLGYCRFSAYDISDFRLRAAVAQLLKFKPSYVISYSVALDLFARINQHLKQEFHGLKMKAAIATAESFPRSDSADLIADILGCPVVMEYGAVETGPIAHQNKEGYFSVFWRHYFVEGQESRYLPGTYNLILTSLYPRCFPLIRYEIGDLAALRKNDSLLQYFDGIIGRCNDYIILEDKSLVHSEAFTHAVKDCKSITDFQVIQSSSGHISINYVGIGNVANLEIKEVRQRLSKISPFLAGIETRQVKLLKKTIAGKTRRIIREDF
jgi:phenylacetate-CoA ligase